MSKNNNFEIFWGDLTPECQKELYKFLGDNNGNYDVSPIITLTNEFIAVDDDDDDDGE